jgi:hypothetical protein
MAEPPKNIKCNLHPLRKPCILRGNMGGRLSLHHFFRRVPHLTDQPDLANDLLRGAKALALECYGTDDAAAVRRIYHEQERWPFFKLNETGVLYGLRSRIRAHLAAKSAEKEARIAAAAANPVTVKSTGPKPRRRCHMRAHASENT